MHETLEVNHLHQILQIKGYSRVRVIKYLIKADRSDRLSPGLARLRFLTCVSSHVSC